MKTSIADRTVFAAHAQWCEGHLGDTCISRDEVIRTHSPFDEREHGEAYVSIEQVAGADLAAVRLSGAADSPMSAVQAFQVGSALIRAAFAAVTGQAVTR